MSLKEKIEEHPAIFAFTIMLSSFIAGLVVYNKGLEIFKYQTVSNYELEKREEDKQALKEGIQDLKTENQELRQAVLDLRLKLNKHGFMKDSEVSAPITKEDIVVEKTKKVQKPKQKPVPAKPQRTWQDLITPTLGALFLVCLIMIFLPKLFGF